jgi:virginiamycin B lyase
MNTKNRMYIVIISALVLLLVISGGMTYAGVFSKNNSITTSTVTGKSGQFSAGSFSSQFVTEYRLPNGLPNAIAVDSYGRVWTVLQNSSSLGVFNPTNETVRQIPIPGLKPPLTSWGIAIDNSRGLVWFSEEISNSIWAYNMQEEVFKEYVIPTSESNPYQVALDQKGNAWFSEFSGDRIGVVATNGTVLEFQIPIASSNPTGITVDPRTNRVWFNLLDTSGATDQFYVGSFYQGSFIFNDITPLVDTPVGIAIDSSGNLWLTQHGASLVSEFNPVTHYFRTISTSIPPDGASYPYFVYVDNSSGNIWFNEHYGNAITVFDPKSDTLVEYEIPSRNANDGNISGALTMTLSPTGVPWFTELYTGKIGDLNSSSPLGVSLNVSTQKVSLENESTSVVQLTIGGSNNQTTYLSATVGNFTGNFLFNFTQYSGKGNYSTDFSIQNAGSPPGVYFATLSVESKNVILSRIIEIQCIG